MSTATCLKCGTILERGKCSTCTKGSGIDFPFEYPCSPGALNSVPAKNPGIIKIKSAKGGVMSRDKIKYRYIHKRYNGHFLAINQNTQGLECLYEGCNVNSPTCGLTPFGSTCASPNKTLKFDIKQLDHFISYHETILSSSLGGSRPLSENFIDELISTKGDRT